MKPQGKDWIFTFGCFMMSISSIGFYRSYSDILVIFMDHFGAQRQAAMMPYTIMECVTCAICPFIFMLVKYIDPKKLLLCSGLLIFLGCGSVGLMPRLEAVAWISFFVIGLGMGSPFVLLTTLVDAKFRVCHKRSRVLATGIIASGTSLGSLLGTATISIGYEMAGYHVTFFTLATGILFTYSLGLLIIHFSDRELETPESQVEKPSETNGNTVPLSERITKNIALFFEVFKYPLFYLLSMSYVAYGTAALIFLTTALDHGRDLGLNSFPRPDSLFLGFELLAKLWWGVPFKLFNLPAPVGMALGLMSLGALLTTVAVCVVDWIQKTCAALMGFVGCVPFLLMPLLLADLLGPSAQVAGLGWSRFLLGISSVIRTLLVGVFRDGMGSYEYVYIIAAAPSLIIGLAWAVLCLLRFFPSKPPESHQCCPAQTEAQPV